MRDPSSRNPFDPPEDDRDDCDELVPIAKVYLSSRAGGSGGAAPPPDPWDRFYRACDPLIHETLRGRRLPDDLVEDCAQEVWRLLIVRLPRFDYDPRRGRFRAWLAVLARHAAADLVRRARRRATALPPGALARLVDHRPGPASDFERRRLQGLVRDTLAELRPRVSSRSYTVFYEHRVEARPLAEVAGRLGLTPAQARARHDRVVRKFRALLLRRRGGDEGSW